MTTFAKTTAAATKLAAAIVLAALAALFPVPASAVAFNVVEHRDIVFAEVDGLKLAGDIYVPEGEGPFPGILSIHGGGFVGGSKNWSSLPPFMRFYASLGYVVFNVDYRLLGEGGIFPNNIKDVKCALTWMRAHAADYNIDPARIAALGESAGAYLAAMVALTANMPEFQPYIPEYADADTSVVAAVLYYAPLNFVNFENPFSRLLEAEMQRLAKIKSKKELMVFKRKYSPINYVKNAPPLFISYSDPDRTVPPDQSREMAAALKAAGKIVDVLEVTGEGMDHGFVIMSPDSEQAAEARSRSAAFLEKYLAKKD
ncbi:MAG TPA: alpha/beta hydrolase [bacterium]|nr:alpha/beta hydrolase [bacterium]